MGVFDGKGFCFHYVLVLSQLALCPAFVLDSTNYPVNPGMLTCFDCSDVADPKDCDRISVCGRDQQCFVNFAPLRTTLRYAYRMSCISSVICNVLTSQTSIVSSTTCTQCCNTSYCNRDACDNWTTANYLHHQVTSTSSGPVQVSSHGGTVYPTTASTVPTKPHITGKNSAPYSLAVHLDCTVSGSVLAIHWHYNQTGPLPPEVISSGGVLTISNLNETRAGMYTCMAVDHNGMISTANVMVTIQDTPPIVVSVIKTPTVLILGQPFTIRCSVIGYPKPRITWNFVAAGGIRVVPRQIRFSPDQTIVEVLHTNRNIDMYLFIFQADGRSVFPSQPDGSSVIPSEVRFSSDQTTIEVLHYNHIYHDGRWTCTATNALGRSQAAMHIP